MEKNSLFSSRLFGASLLVTGCCIGGGMLALPVVTAPAGFIPTALLFTIICCYLIISGLFLIEVNLWLDRGASFLTMAEVTLGKAGKWLSGGLFMFLFYSIMVGYISGGGELLQVFFREYFNLKLSLGLCLTFTAVSLGVIIYAGTAFVDGVNRAFMAGLLITYCILIFIGFEAMHVDFLKHIELRYALLAIPVMVVSFGYHNLIPTLCEYLGQDRKSLIVAIVRGSVAALCCYLLWNAVILGIIPRGSLEAIYSGEMITYALRQATGASWITIIGELFAFFALVTSFLGVGISLVDFMRDGFHVHGQGAPRLLFCLLTVIPPLTIAILNPGLFLVALGYAGGYIAVILFGLIPPLMVWRGRYVLGMKGVQTFGGKALLSAMFVFSILILATQIFEPYIRGMHL